MDEPERQFEGIAQALKGNKTSTQLPLVLLNGQIVPSKLTSNMNCRPSLRMVALDWLDYDRRGRSQDYLP